MAGVEPLSCHIPVPESARTIAPERRLEYQIHVLDIRGERCIRWGLLQDGACWLMAFPEKEGRASFRLTFAKETLPTAAAERILDVFCQFLCAINSSSQQDKVASLLPSPPEETFLDDVHNTPSSQNPFIPRHDASPPPSITSSLATVAERIESLWTQVLLPDDVDPRRCTSAEHGKWSPNPFPHDISFFDMGGDSISAAELAALGTAAGLQLGLQDILNFPTVEQQSLFVAGQIERSPVRDAPKLVFSEGYGFN